MIQSDDQKRCIMVAVSKKQVIGICSAQLFVSTAKGGMAALIEDMVVGNTVDLPA